MWSRKVSAGKSLSWRLIGVALLAVVTWVITRNMITVSLIVFMHHLAFYFIFYVHDRAWGEGGQAWKVWVKGFTYEILLGFLVLGVITFVVTGSWKQVTLITVIYLPIRYLGFPLHERLWSNRDANGRSWKS